MPCNERNSAKKRGASVTPPREPCELQYHSPPDTCFKLSLEDRLLKAEQRREVRVEVLLFLKGRKTWGVRVTRYKLGTRLRRECLQEVCHIAVEISGWN